MAADIDTLLDRIYEMNQLIAGFAVGSVYRLPPPLTENLDLPVIYAIPSGWLERKDPKVGIIEEALIDLEILWTHIDRNYFADVVSAAELEVTALEKAVKRHYGLNRHLSIPSDPEGLDMVYNPLIMRGTNAKPMVATGDGETYFGAVLTLTIPCVSEITMY